MLTNNKKNFVRSIAMLLAMLMVLAVCLTGCGNKTADEALAKAEEAKTVADEVKAALAGYLTTADAEAKVAALVDAALADGAATAEELDALAAKLENYVTTDKVAELIKTEVAKNAIAGAMTKDEIMEILENYYTKDEVDAKLESYFGDMEPAAVYKMMQDVEKAMNENEWNAASEIVIETIAAMQDLIEAVENELYTQENMKAVNEKLAPLGVKAFVVDVDDKDGDNDKEDLVVPSVYSVDFGKMLEYTILRVASVEAMEELKAAVEAAAAVATYESELEALKAELFAMGELVAYGEYPYNNDPSKAKAKIFEADEWTKAGSYHGVDYAKEAKKLAQVVTLNDKADFYAWGKALDALVTTYVDDGVLVSDLTVYSVFSKTSLVAGEVVTTITKQEKDPDPTKDVLAGYTKVGETVITDDAYLAKIYDANELTKYEEANNAVLALPTSFFPYNSATLAAVETDWKNTGKYGYSGNTTIMTDAELTYGDKDAQEDEEWKNAYNAIVAQLNECQTAANAANVKFDNFQKNTIYAYTVELMNSKQYVYVTDEELLAALVADMCERGGLNSYPSYLTDVQTLMLRTYALNGKTAAGVKEYDLYLKMLDKSYDLLWDKYQNQAYDWADEILADYISVADNALAVGSVYDNAIGTATTAAWTTDFVKAFVEGTALTDAMYVALEHDFDEDYLEMFYENNAHALDVDTENSIGKTAMTYKPYYANPLKTIKENAEDIKLRLTGAMLEIDLKIGAASKDAMKASGVTVQKAFYDILNEGIANLEEVYDRFLLDDYKKMTYNNTVALAMDVIDFYYDGVNTYDVEIDAALLKSAMQEYLMGIDIAKTTATANSLGAYVGTSTDKNINDSAYAGTVKVNSSNAKIESLTPGKNQLNDELGMNLDDHQLLSNIKGISVNKYSTNTDKVASAAMVQIDGYADKAIAKIENITIKTNFEEYLEAARTNWLTLRLAYTAEVNSFNNANANLYAAMLYDMQLLNSEVEDTITVVSYNAKRGESGIALDDYKANYVEVLKLIADKNNKHVALLSDEAIADVIADNATIKAEVVEDALELIKTSLDLPTNEDGTNATWASDVVGKKPLTPYGQHATEVGTINLGDYVFVGTAAVNLDKLVNANTAYVQDKVEVKLY